MSKERRNKNIKQAGSHKGSVNREYKDRLFKFIFGNPENKEWTLSLYNAVNGSDYKDASQIKLNSIENALYMGMKNDVSFIITDVMCFFEQQSTFNPNMPARYLVYAGMVYAGYIESNKNYHRYSTAIQKLPVPRCICFYNGKDEKNDRVILKLSDAFDNDVNTDIEVTVTMININYGHNRDLLNKCQPLSEYAWLVNRIRECLKEKDNLEEAVDAALLEMQEDALIKPYLLDNRAEVKYMFLTEYDEERTLAETWEDGREEGRTEGRAEGRAEGFTEAAKLMAYLAQNGRYDDINRAAEDEEYMKMLYDEFMK